MSRFVAAIGLATAVMAAALSFHPRLSPSHAQSQPPRGNTSPCAGTITGTLSANTVRMCDPLSVTVKVVPSCPICPNGVNVVYVQIDKARDAEWMDQESLKSLDSLVDHASRKPGYPFRVGVVHYNMQGVRKALPMTGDLDAARRPLSVPKRGEEPLGDVIGAARTALEMLRDARRQAANISEGDHPCEFVVFFAYSKPSLANQVRDLLAAAHMIKSEGIKLFVGCPDSAAYICKVTEQMAEKSRFYTEAPEHGKLSQMVEEHLQGLDDSAVTVHDLTLTQLLPPGLAYVEGSANVVPKAVNRAPDDRIRLDWTWTSTTAQTVTYGVRPLAEGTGKIEGTARLVDSSGENRDLPMASQPVTVTGLCLPPPTATPTDFPGPSATSTDTPTPTFTASPTTTNTPTRTDTPTPAPRPIYLPVLLHERCTIQWVYSDVALVIDTSTSMNQRIGGGRTKLDATLGAAKAFLSIMDFTPDAEDRSDRVAVIGFNHRAWLAAGLTRDAAALKRAVDDLPSGQAAGTRLDLGFDQGLSTLQPALGTPNTTPVIILLTDGLPSRVPPDPGDGTMETTVRKAAQQAKDAGVKVYTIGIGLPEDINGSLMRQCATSPGDYFHTPDPEALAGIYTQIAYAFGCPKGRHAWGQPWP